MTYSVKEIQERYGVGEHTVYKWIKSGELPAVNVSPVRNGKPKYRVTQDGLDEFESLRATNVAVVPSRKRRRKKQTSSAVKFY